MCPPELKRAKRNTLHGYVLQKMKRKLHCGCVLQKIKKNALRIRTPEKKEKTAVRLRKPKNQEKTAKSMRQPKNKEKNAKRMQKKLNEKRDNLNKEFECLDEIDTDTYVPIIKPNIIESFRNAQTYLHRTMVDGNRNIHKGLVRVMCDGQITGTDPVCYLDKEQIDKYRKIFSVQSYNECFGGEINPVLLSKAV